jgi:hypothetical protein
VSLPAGILAGRREAALLALPSVARMAGILSARCREPSWVRVLVPALDRFGALTARTDLEGLLDAACSDPAVAERALARFAAKLDGCPDATVAGLAMGPKVWFRLNGVPVPWRPLAAAPSRPPLAACDPADRLVLLALIGSGLRLAELLRVRLGDLGSLGSDGTVLPDLDAEPLALAFQQRQGRVAERVTFLSWPARRAVLDELDRRRRAGLATGPDAALVLGPHGAPATDATVAGARRRSGALIGTANRLNVDLCRKTGEFFKAWGLPGSRFEPARERGL